MTIVDNQARKYASQVVESFTETLLTGGLNELHPDEAFYVITEYNLAVNIIHASYLHSDRSKGVFTNDGVELTTQGYGEGAHLVLSSDGSTTRILMTIKEREGVVRAEFELIPQILKRVGGLEGLKSGEPIKSSYVLTPYTSEHKAIADLIKQSDHIVEKEFCVDSTQKLMNSVLFQYDDLDDLGGDSLDDDYQDTDEDGDYYAEDTYDDDYYYDAYDDEDDYEENLSNAEKLAQIEYLKNVDVNGDKDDLQKYIEKNNAKNAEEEEAYSPQKALYVHGKKAYMDGAVHMPIQYMISKGIAEATISVSRAYMSHKIGEATTSISLSDMAHEIGNNAENSYDPTWQRNINEKIQEYIRDTDKYTGKDCYNDTLTVNELLALDYVLRMVQDATFRYEAIFSDIKARKPISTDSLILFSEAINKLQRV